MTSSSDATKGKLPLLSRKCGKRKRAGFISIGWASTLLILSGISMASPLVPILPSGEAPRDGMLEGRWSAGNKQAFGTAYEAYDSNVKYSNQSLTVPISRVWFTAAKGALTEVYWPTVDMPQTRDNQFLITDGKSFFAEERQATISTATWLRSGIPAFHIINKDPDNRFTIEKTLYADPDRDTVVQHVKITRHVAGLKFYVLHNPQVGATPMGNSGQASMGGVLPTGLYAWQGNQAQALIFSIPVLEVSASFAGPYDGFQDVRDHLKMEYHFEHASGGNVVLTARMEIPEDIGTTEFDILLGFGTDVHAAFQSADGTLKAGAGTVLDKYTSQWSAYQRSVRDLSQASLDHGRLFRASVAVIKSMEDKTYEGAFIASPSVPWGEFSPDKNVAPLENSLRPRQYLTGGYHVVWPRDLFQMATTMMAIEDYSSAIAALNRLKTLQYKSGDGEWSYGSHKHSRDGSFPQNVWVNGEPNWGGLQLDETAMPVMLAERLWQAGRIRWQDYWDMVKRAADFIADFGPWSAQERWEESFGASPSNIAAEIAALRAASRFAEAARDSQRAQRYRDLAEHWASKPGDNVDTWCFTTTGPWGNGKYYTRLEGAAWFDQPWNPDDDADIYLANSAGRYKEKAIIDGGFLELVRYGVKSALDYHILESIPEYDQMIRVDIPGKGSSFRRYLHDRYGTDDLTGQQTDGMLWPVLTGERGHYELAKAIEEKLSPAEIYAGVDPYISAIESFATPTLMIPEQVWDRGSRAGTSTGSSTPLGWSHAEYVKLLRSALDQKVFDR